MEDYALIARQEEHIKALKTENDYLKKVKNPTEVENAKLRQRNDTLDQKNYALELENQSLQSEIQVMNEKHNSQVAELESDLEVTKQDAESAKAQNFELIGQHRREKKIELLRTACFSVVLAVLASIVTYNVGSNRAPYVQANHDKIQASHDRMEKILNENEDNIQLGKVINYLFDRETSSETIYPTMVSRNTGIDSDAVLSILLKLEEHGIVTKSQFPGVRQPQFQLK